MTTEGQILFRAAQVLEPQIKRGFQAQGHHLTGAWEDSIFSVVGGDGNILEGFARYYGSIVNAGVVPGRVPYGGTGGGTGAKTSKYIDGLTAFFIARGLDPKEAKNAAFATANVHKKEGMPSPGSYLYSGTGMRTDFIDGVNEAVGPEIDELIITGLDFMVEEQTHELKTQTI